MRTFKLHFALLLFCFSLLACKSGTPVPARMSVPHEPAPGPHTHTVNIKSNTQTGNWDHGMDFQSDAANAKELAGWILDLRGDDDQGTFPHCGHVPEYVREAYQATGGNTRDKWRLQFKGQVWECNIDGRQLFQTAWEAE